MKTTMKMIIICFIGSTLLLGCSTQMKNETKESGSAMSSKSSSSSIPKIAQSTNSSDGSTVNISQEMLDDLLQLNLDNNKKNKWKVLDDDEKYADLAMAFGMFDEKNNIGFLGSHNHYAIINLSNKIILGKDGHSFEIEVNIDEEKSFNVQSYEQKKMHFEIEKDKNNYYLLVTPLLPKGYEIKQLKYYRADHIPSKGTNLSSEYTDRIVNAMNVGLRDIENYSSNVLVRKVDDHYEHNAGAYWGLLPIKFNQSNNSILYDTDEILNSGQSSNDPLGYWRENSSGEIEFSKDRSWTKVYKETNISDEIITSWKNFVGSDEYQNKIYTINPSPNAELLWSSSFAQALDDSIILDNATKLGITSSPTQEQLVQLAEAVALSAPPVANYEELIKQQNPNISISKIEINTGSTPKGMITYSLYVILSGKEYLHVNFSPINGWQHG